MPKLITVLCIAPAQTVRGGITSLIEKIRERFPDHIQFQIVPTISQYTGNEHPDRGNKLVQGIIFGKAFLRVVVAGIFSRGTVFHIHLSMKGSTLRKGIVCVTLRVLRCRYVVHAHAAEDSLFQNWVPQRMRRLLVWGIGGADFFIVLTRFWGDFFANAMHLPANRLLVLPNPAVVPESIPDRTNREGLNFLFLGRIGERKGAFESIRAFANLPDDIRKRARLTLAGDGEIETARNLAGQLGYSLQVCVMDWVERERANGLLGEADVFLLPSRGEGMSMALLEAMAWGLPVVATSSGGADEFLSNGRNCILVNPGDVNGISAAMSALAGDPQLRLRMGMEARKTVNRFSVESYMKKLTCLYEYLANNPSGRNPTRAVFTTHKEEDPTGLDARYGQTEITPSTLGEAIK